MKSRIMYIEYKGDGIIGPGRIGRVTFSKSGESVYYRGKRLETLAGYGYKANYRDVKTDEHYWISGPKKRGDDTLYPGVIEIDENVREEYWLTIRKRPDLVGKSKIRSEGKYSRRRPR